MNEVLFSLINSEDILYLADAKQFCTFKVGGKIEYLICPKTLDSFCKYLLELNNHKVKYKVVGNMSNILPCDGLNRGVYITTRYILEEPQFFANSVMAYCGYSLGALSYKCASLGLGGIENLIGIPATIGGAVYNNAGAFGQSISDCLESLLIYSNGKIISVKADYAKLSYRSSVFQTSGEIVLSATFRLKKQPAQKLIENQTQVSFKRKTMQPILPSAGSVFKKANNLSAGKLIDQTGLKGKTIGKAQISTLHANFIVNLGGATSNDVKKLVNLAQKIVKQKFNITLQREIEYIGETNGHTCRLPHS